MHATVSCLGQQATMQDPLAFRGSLSTRRGEIGSMRTARTRLQAGTRPIVFFINAARLGMNGVRKAMAHCWVKVVLIQGAVAYGLIEGR